MRILRLPEVAARSGLSRSSIYLRMSEGSFPRSIPLGPRAVGWLESDLDDWIGSRVRASGRIKLLILPFNDEYRIASDRYQWIIQKSHQRKRNGELVTEWESQSFFPTYEGAVEELGERMVRESDAVGFAEALVAVENVVTTLSQALPTHISVASAGETDRQQVA